MKKTYLSAASAALAFAAVLLSGCSDGGPEYADKENLSFGIELISVGANEVTAQIRHNGTEDVTYYAFCYNDFHQGETLAVEKAVAAVKESGTDISTLLSRGSDTEVTCSGLQSGTLYRLVVVGLDEQYNIYGTPASVFFDTIKGAVIYEPNPDWIVSYLGKQAASDNSGYGDVVQVITYETTDGFFAIAVPLSEYEEKGIEGCITDAVAEKEAEFARLEDQGYLVDRSDYVYYNATAFILDMEEGVEYVGIAAGVDDNFEPTGLYAVSAPFSTEVVEYSEAYGKWLGTWTISGYYEDGNGLHPIEYDINIDYLVPDETYLIDGYQPETAISLPFVQAGFDATTGGLVFTSSYAGDRYDSNGTYYTIYFFATRSQQNNVSFLNTQTSYTIATASMTGNTAVVRANENLTESGGTPFNATEMQFVAFRNANPNDPALFTYVPRFPFNMEKK